MDALSVRWMSESFSHSYCLSRFGDPASRHEEGEHIHSIGART